MWYFRLFLAIVLLFPTLAGCSQDRAGEQALSAGYVIITLPQPEYGGEVSVEEAILQRRSIREYSNEPLTLKEVSQLLWAAQGVTSPAGLRAAPSAGALYPLEIYLVAGEVEGFSPGVYNYRPEPHELARVADGDLREALYGVALRQESVRSAAIDIVITGVMERTTGKYGERGIRYVYMEAGHAAQNLYLQGVALGVGMVVIGAFEDGRVQEMLNLPPDAVPLYIIPAGKTAGENGG